MKISPNAIEHGVKLLADPLRNKGTAFTEVERDALGLRGLLPPHIHTQDEQMSRFLEHMRKLPDALEKFVALSALHDRNEALFFRVVCDHVDEIMPLIYTPTVGLACQRFGHIFQSLAASNSDCFDQNFVTIDYSIAVIDFDIRVNT